MSLGLKSCELSLAADFCCLDPVKVKVTPCCISSVTSKIILRIMKAAIKGSDLLDCPISSCPAGVNFLEVFSGHGLTEEEATKQNCGLSQDKHFQISKTGQNPGQAGLLIFLPEVSCDA